VATGPGGIFASHDGGRTWQAITREGSYGPALTFGATVWALKTACNDSPACSAALATSGDAGRTWTTRPVPGAFLRASLVRTGPRSAFIVWFPAAPKAQILVTTDGGTTWAGRATPCPSGTDLDAQLAHLGTDVLGLLCDSQQTAGEQPKALYGSTNAGASWTLLASTPPFFGTHQQAIGNLPSAGYSQEMVFVSSSVGYLALGRGTLYGTTDGGRDWSEAITDADIVGNGVDHVRFIDALHGWTTTATDAGALIYRTGDAGRTWSRITVP
jgi:photosystem II stability/assembly factor-like uncharacterized protein